MTPNDKQKVIDFILKEPNNNYFNCKSRKDGIWSCQEVYDAFKDDSFWYVKLHKYGLVKFSERKLREITKKNKRMTMMTFVHYVTKQRWLFPRYDEPKTNGKIVIYGGFARSAFLAWYSCKQTIYESILCFKRYKVPKDIVKMILVPILRSWCNDFTWFKDKIYDIDMLVHYHNDIPETHEFESDVAYIRNILNKLCSKIESVYSYKPIINRCYSKSKNIDGNCRRNGETSHRDGDYYNYLVNFSYSYKSELTRKYSKIALDITTMIDNDRNDLDVNNLVLYYDFKKQMFRFDQRKKIIIGGKVLTMKEIENNIVKRQFRRIPFYYKTFENYKKFLEFYRTLEKRVSNMEYRGWKQDPKFLIMGESYIEKAKRYFNEK